MQYDANKRNKLIISWTEDFKEKYWNTSIFVFKQTLRQDTFLFLYEHNEINKIFK